MAGAASALPHLLHSWGYLAVFLAVLADSFGLPVPGELMLILAGVYAGATHHLALPLVIAAAAFGAIAGDNTTYALGRMGGYPMLRRYGRVIHLGRHLTVGQYLFRRYGARIVWAGRLIPILHIWTALLAGLNRMTWLRFALANAAGSAVWAGVLGLAGYAVGRVALRAGGLIEGAALPLSILIGVGIIVLLRARERRWYLEAEREVEPRERAA